MPYHMTSSERSFERVGVHLAQGLAEHQSDGGEQLLVHHFFHKKQEL